MGTYWTTFYLTSCLISSPEKISWWWYDDCDYDYDDGDDDDDDDDDANNKVLQPQQNSVCPYTCLDNSLTRDIIEFDY
jgi:hypothetical protein